MLEAKDILECIEGYIIVVDQNGKIVFTNNPDAVSLYKHFGIENDKDIIDFHSKYYNTQTRKIDKGNGEEYTYVYYQDVTKAYEMAMIDSLTKIYNRRGINKAVENYRTALNTSCVVYGDIDFFKKINDNYSHEAGDFVLSEVAQLLTDSVRNDDLVGRMGGEEFLIILNSTNVAKAKPKLETIRSKIKEHKFIWDGNNIPVTISFGVSEFNPEIGSDIERTITEADSALRYSKENGRDQVNYFNEIQKVSNQSKNR